MLKVLHGWVLDKLDRFFRGQVSQQSSDEAASSELGEYFAHEFPHYGGFSTGMGH